MDQRLHLCDSSENCSSHHLLSAEICWVLPCFFYLESYRSCIISGEVKLEGPTKKRTRHVQGCVVSLSLNIRVVAATFPEPDKVII